MITDWYPEAHVERKQGQVELDPEQSMSIAQWMSQVTMTSAEMCGGLASQSKLIAKDAGDAAPGRAQTKLASATTDGKIDPSPTECPIGGKYGTCRDLTIDDMRTIVARCLDFKARGGSVPEFYRRQNISFNEPRSYALETLRGWLKNPRFAPRDTQ